MIIEIDWTAFVFGAGAGLVVGTLFFAGLALGMRLALRVARPMAVLLPSSVIRIALLLATGWWIAGQGATALVGFALAFIALRFVLLASLRPKTVERSALWS